jgi:hypothetical protein
MVASSKCDFSVIGDGLSLSIDNDGGKSRVDFNDRLGSVRSVSSKCDWKFQAEDFIDRFSLAARVASSKCDFSVTVDFGLKGGQHFRAAGGSSSKCDFSFSRFERISNPGLKKDG